MDPTPLRLATCLTSDAADLTYRILTDDRSDLPAVAEGLAGQATRLAAALSADRRPSAPEVAPPPPPRANPGSPESWLSKRQLAARYGVTERTINRWHHEGLPFTSEGVNRYLASETDPWLTKRDGRHASST